MTKAKNQIETVLNRLYWFVPVALFSLQAVYTFSSMNQIRYEELAETVRNVFWFENGFVYDGISSSIGWYSLLLPIYKIFGFDLFTAKFVRLALQLISLFALAGILKRYLGPTGAFVPLVTLGLAPTFLYFNTLNAQFGIDLQYLPVILFLLITLDFINPARAFLQQILIWTLAMFVWMTYPTFAVYIPALVLFYLYQLKAQKAKEEVIKNISISVLAFVLPLILGFLYVQNRELLWYDPTVKSGIFRGAGVLRFDSEIFFRNIELNIKNLFSMAYGYYYEVKKVDFSDFYPIVSLLMGLYCTIKLFSRKKKNYLPIFLILLTLIVNGFIVYFSVDPTPGLRRATGILVSLYGFYVLGWLYAISHKWQDKFAKWLVLFSFLLLPLHHLIVYPTNLSHISDPSLFRETTWFIRSSSPQESLSLFLNDVKEDNLRLVCVDKLQQEADCRYSEIYAAIAGTCNWNKLACHNIYGYDLKTKQFIPLSIDLWTSYYFKH